MSKMVQIRNMPDTMHRILKAKAALAGMSLSDFLLAEMRLVAERPSIEELRARVRNRTKFEGLTPAADIIRQERDSR
jgi:plasmid stability protein